jgi:hypothetical protein
MFLPSHEGIFHVMTKEDRAHAHRVEEALARFMKKGGGVYCQPTVSRYPAGTDVQFWNMVTKPFGLQVLDEACIDRGREYKARVIETEASFWFTENIAPHPVTEGVSSLYLPFYDFSMRPGLPAVAYSSDWDVIVKGEKEARSYPAIAEGTQTLFDKEGTYASEPPIVAVREFGKGRMVSYPMLPTHWFYNINNKFWRNTVEMVGDPESNRPSHSQKMIVNALKWLAEPARTNPELGTYVPSPYERAQFPESVEWTGTLLARPHTDQVKGIFGIRTAYSGGKGTVQEYADAAKKAGLSFIVFNEFLEHMTAEKLEQLKSDCKAVSNENFYACPGVEFTDGIGCRWAMWKDAIQFPIKERTMGGVLYPNWDGERVWQRGMYTYNNGLAPTVLLDYNELRKAGSRPEHMWWFFQHAPEVYDIEGEKAIKVADNYTTFLSDLSNLTYSSLISYTRVDSPDEVATASQTLTTRFKNLELAKEFLNRGNNFFESHRGMEYVSGGPDITAWSATNTQMEQNWRYTRGAQRVQCFFEVRSDVGIKEIIIHDADAGPVRHYYPEGETFFRRSFEMVQDKQRYLTIEVTDIHSKKAYSWYQFLHCYKDGIRRCGDNLNTLGSMNLNWYPDRYWMMPNSKSLTNGYLYTLYGFDSSTSVCPKPTSDGIDPPTSINIKGYGWYPNVAKEKAINADYKRVKMCSQNIQIATAVVDGLGEPYDTKMRPAPAHASPPRIVADNEYYSRHDTLYALNDRSDHFIMWNYRRIHESLEEYNGGLVWYEGTIKFKKDITLQGDMPIPLFPVDNPLREGTDWATRVMAVGPKGMYTKTVDELLNQKPLKIKAGGFVSVYPSMLGEFAFLAPKGSEYVYTIQKVGVDNVRLTVGMGHDGQKFKAGDTITFKYAVATIANITDNPVEDVQRVARQLNIGGGSDGYRIDMRTGELLDAEFFFTALAADHECSFEAGPAGVMPTDLAFRVNGITDNGCAAVYTSNRPWFRFISVVDDTAYFQENIDEGVSVWVGNIFVADNKEIKMSVTIDGLLEGEKPKIEIHNPTQRDIYTKVYSPAVTPHYGGTYFYVNVPAGDSVIMEIPEKKKPSETLYTVIKQWDFEESAKGWSIRSLIYESVKQK